MTTKIKLLIPLMAVIVMILALTGLSGCGVSSPSGGSGGTTPPPVVSGTLSIQSISPAMLTASTGTVAIVLASPSIPVNYISFSASGGGAVMQTAIFRQMTTTTTVITASVPVNAVSGPITVNTSLGVLNSPSVPVAQPPVVLPPASSVPVAWYYLHALIQVNMDTGVAIIGVAVDSWASGRGVFNSTATVLLTDANGVVNSLPFNLNSYGPAIMVLYPGAPIKFDITFSDASDPVGMVRNYTTNSPALTLTTTSPASGQVFSASSAISVAWASNQPASTYESGFSVVDMVGNVVVPYRSFPGSQTTATISALPAGSYVVTIGIRKKILFSGPGYLDQNSFVDCSTYREIPIVVQ